MADDAELKLTFRLVPADDRPADPVVLDDIVRLIRQGVVTAPNVTVPADGFREPNEDENRTLRGLEAKIESRIQAASAASQAAVEKWKRTEPAEVRSAAERLIAAAQRAALHGVAVRVPDPGDAH